MANITRSAILKRGMRDSDRLGSLRRSNVQRQSLSLWPLLFIGVILCAVNCSAALFAPIQDCDEVFNYWEPTHYLNHGYGLQTWEYSPAYAIRSWLYIVLHALLGKSSWILSVKKSNEFIYIRILLGIFCALCQLKLFKAVAVNVGLRVAFIMILVMTSSTGMFYASVAYLPSGFCMCTTMIGMAAFIDVRDRLKTKQGVVWFGVGAIVGWPFSAALILPLFMDELVCIKRTADVKGAFWRVLSGITLLLPIIGIDITVNAVFFHRLAFSPWRIISYNIFSGSSRGPDIFGTEPWHFYLRNLLLNFNAWFLLALCAGPILALQLMFRCPSTTKLTLLRTLVFTAPFYLWFAIFTAQPHKEERFMYPAYPFLSLCAAITLHNMLYSLGHLGRTSLFGRTSSILRAVLAAGGILLVVAVGLLRTYGTIKAYGGPLLIYTPLHSGQYKNAEGSVCLGKEWYRFPSSFFLPDKMRARFIKSEFDGLLPGQFSEENDGFGLPKSWTTPEGMNDRNIEDPGKHVDISTCSFLVDSHFPGAEPAPSPSASTSANTPTSFSQDSLGVKYTASVLQFRISSDIPLALRERFPSRFRALGAIVQSPTTSMAPGHIEVLAHLISQNIKFLSYGGLLAATIIYVLANKFIYRKKPAVGRQSSPDPEKPGSTRPSKFKAPARQPGQWPPSDFKRPAAQPLLDWDVHKTQPLPYRPFRYGPYNITMGLRTMQWDEWIELDNHYLKYHADKARRISERGEKCCRTAPEAMDGAIELLVELCDYLPQRYPTLFQTTPTGIVNLATSETFNIVQRPLPEDPMAMSARLIQDDVIIMFEKEDGQYYLLAGAVLLGGFWRLSDKFGMPLSEIHTSGDVPGYRQKLEKGMENFFRRIQPNAPMLRYNYFLQVDDELAWSSSIGPEDSDQPHTVGWQTSEKNKAIESLHFRAERQSLRRLPRSGGVVFTVRTYFEPVMAIAQEPGVPGRLASAVRSWGDDVGRYKGRQNYEGVLLEYLDEEHKKQVEAGVAEMEGKEDERAAFPF
ncbi:MAG: hypothetical protein Q9163_001128 [Psora crenata]